MITQTKGKAAEYAPYGLTLYETCPHACRYCYCPYMPPWRKTGLPPEDFHKPAKPRPGVLSKLRDLLQRRRIDAPIMLCFMCDPFPPGLDPADDITKRSLVAFAGTGVDPIILTKGGLRAEACFDLMRAWGWWFGQTVVLSNPLDLADWEPNAAPWEDRVAALQIAHELGIPTWISLEPVIYTDQALDVIDRLLPWVDHWKIGKLTPRTQEHAAIEQRQDWRAFVDQARRLLSSYIEDRNPGTFSRGTYYIKDTLRQTIASTQ